MRIQIVRWIDAELKKGEEGFQANDLAKKTSLLDAVHLLATSWNCITDTTVRNCFKKGGLTTIDVDEDIEVQPLPPEPSDLTEKEYADWIAVDDNVPCSTGTTEEELCHQIMTGTVGAVESDEEDDTTPDPLPAPPSHGDMLKTLDVLSRGFQFYGENVNLHYSYVAHVHKMLESSKKQTNIDSFFSK